MSDNGYISFATIGSGINFYTAQTFPIATVPNNVIALAMVNLAPTAGSIRYFTSGTAPNRVFVIDFNAVPHFNTTGTLTGQIQLYETSNTIEIHLSSETNTTLNKTVGIENATGTVGYAPAGRNNAIWNTATPEAYRFTPSTPTFTYNWSPAGTLSDATIANPVASNLTATTTYTVTVTNSGTGCTATASTTVTVNTVAAAIAPSTPAICGSGSVTLTASGGTTYAWSTTETTAAITVSPTTTTTYTVTVTGTGGCTATASVTVTVNPIPTATIMPASATICAGSNASLTASGGTSYTSVNRSNNGYHFGFASVPLPFIR